MLVYPFERRPEQGAINTMKTTPLAAHRESLHTSIHHPLGLSERRRVTARPLRRTSRLLDQSALGRVIRECDGIATVEYYGHPSRRMAIAYPLRGWDGLEETRAAVRNALTVSGGFVSCGNYVFSLSM